MADEMPLGAATPIESVDKDEKEHLLDSINYHLEGAGIIIDP